MRLLLVCIAVLLCAAVGSFGGLFMWDTYKASRVASEAAANAAAAEAFKKTSLGRQREAVKRLLNDPASAEFRNEQASERPGIFCGEVNAKNRMGAMSGFTRYIAELDDATPELAKVDVDQVNPLSDSDRASAANFASRWTIYCR